MAELYRVLHYPRILKQFKPSKDYIDEFIGMIIEKSLITKGKYRLVKIKDDPFDDMFLACAMEAKADYIVSRDPHLRNLKQFHGIKIIDVKSFVEKVKARRRYSYAAVRQSMCNNAPHETRSFLGF
ncbi:MAG: putative toxin-antitoxin system toxin component, PIN family [Deferribacteres bacterium]|nr:putative toxin-antitoxin system toxin component, PIN family [Deferribacteres bacterium]